LPSQASRTAVPRRPRVTSRGKLLLTAEILTISADQVR
jgi:hypothetical protein